jgi:hypothetical protein
MLNLEVTYIDKHYSLLQYLPCSQMLYLGVTDTDMTNNLAYYGNWTSSQMLD